jgi:hypothetical protein
MPSVSLSAEQEAIIKRCEEHYKDGRLQPGFKRYVVFEPYLIKYDSHGSLYPQYQTQQYIYERAVGDDGAPRVPKIYDYFTSERNIAYLVMERLDAEPTPARNDPKKVAEALQWLRRVSAPRDVAIGSLGGGPACHRLFKENTAPLLFSSTEALERYMNRVRHAFTVNGKPLTVT